MLWLDGAIFPDSRAPFDLSDRGLLLGDGVFDTALVLNGRIFRAEAHLRRLIDALAILAHRRRPRRDPRGRRGPDPAWEAPAGRHALRVTVTRGPGLRGLAPVGVQKPTVMASLSPLPPRFFWPRLSMDVAAAPPQRNLAALAHQGALLSRCDPRDARGH